MRKLKLKRIGADPEFIVVLYEDGENQILNARQVFNPEGCGDGTASFIGYDGHNATGELRPPPAHNVNRLVLSVAEGLVAASDWLTGINPRYRLVAKPWVIGEPLGGHIHISFSMEDSCLWNLIFGIGEVGVGYNVEWVPYGLRALLEREPNYQAIRKRIVESRIAIIPSNFAAALGYFLEPLEYWIQPASLARRHGAGYGRPDDVRWIPIPSPVEGLCNLHYEYRMPSTWLVSPRLAYCYLALAKLAFTNYKLVMSAVHDQNTNNFKLYTSSNDDLSIRQKKAEKLLFGRLEETRGLVYSSDLSFLRPTLEWIRANRKGFWVTRPFLDIEEWRQLIPLVNTSSDEPTNEDLPDDPPINLEDD